MRQRIRTRNWGAIIAKPDGTVLITACNTFVDGVAVTAERLEQPEKYKFIEHAERNACFAAARQDILLDGSAMVFGHNPIPCGDCARAIIQCGVDVVIGVDFADDNAKSLASSAPFLTIGSVFWPARCKRSDGLEGFLSKNHFQ